MYYHLKNMNTISLKIPDHLLELLDQTAKERRTTKSSVVRECLENSLTTSKAIEATSCYDLACDLAGSIKGLPRDLAIHSRHMEGFGE